MTATVGAPHATPDAELGAFEVTVMLATAVAVHVAILVWLFTYGNTLLHWFDNVHYVAIADAIRRGRWVCEADCTWHLWGFPFAIAGVASLFRISSLSALLAISAAASLGTVWLVHRLYGGRVAAATIAVSPIWIELAARGGSEPLFMVLTYAALLLWRRNAVWPASMAAAFGAVVRPLPIAGLAFALDAAVGRRSRDVTVLAIVGALGALAYLAGVSAVAGNPIATSSGYLDAGWGGFPIGLPLAGFVASAKPAVMGSTFQTVKAWAWMTFVIIAGWRALRGRGGLDRRAERFAAAAYALFLICGTHVALAAHLPRLALPALPLFLRTIVRWIPSSRWVWWPAAIVCALLGAIGTGRLYAGFGF